MDWMETTGVIVSVEQHTSSTICSMCAKLVCPLIVALLDNRHLIGNINMINSQGSR